MPQRAKSHLGRLRRRHSKPAPLPAADEHLGDPTDVEDVEDVEPNQKVVRDADSRLEFYARLAWLPEYSSVYETEAKINGATGKVDEFASSYRQRQLVAGSDGTREKSEHRISQDLERVLREQDMHYIPFSQAIKSAIYLVETRCQPRSGRRSGRTPANRWPRLRHDAALEDARRASGP